MITKSYKILAIDGAHFADYVAAEDALQKKLASLGGDAEPEEEQSRLLQWADDVAVIAIKGRLTNSDSWYNRYFGMLAYSEIRDAILQAVDADASAILFDHDSPGGSVDGMADTAELIASLDIPTVSFTSSSMMSADYFLASQSDYIYADSFADVGSVGVIVKLYDRTKMLADMGIKPVRFRSGELKAAGDGDFKLSKKEEDYIKDKVMNLAGKFYSIVSAARGMPRETLDALGITSGRTYIGEEALEVNLIDGLKTFDQSMLKAFDVAKKVDKQGRFGLS
jgi:protease-4